MFASEYLNKFYEDCLDKDILLMFGDIPVLNFRLSESYVATINKKYIPYSLRFKFVNVPDYRSGMSESEVRDIINRKSKNREAMVNWLTDRVMPLSRENVKFIHNSLGLEQDSSDKTRLTIAMLCRCVSVLDKYWIRIGDECKTWAEISYGRQHPNKDVADIALHRSSKDITGSLITPDLTTDGVYAKGWRRYVDGNIWLSKKGAESEHEALVEATVSNILDKCNVEHVHYEMGQDKGQYVCVCPCMTDDKYSIVTASEYSSYCDRVELNFIKSILDIDAEGYYKMCIVDYLISNRDRHNRNWGLFMDNETMTVVKLHPLFDHNNAFDTGWMLDKDVRYQASGRPLRETALNAIKHVDFQFTKAITKNDFMNVKQYNSFMDRAEELGIVNPAKSSRLKLKPTRLFSRK